MVTPTKINLLDLVTTEGNQNCDAYFARDDGEVVLFSMPIQIATDLARLRQTITIMSHGEHVLGSPASEAQLAQKLDKIGFSKVAFAFNLGERVEPRKTEPPVASPTISPAPAPQRMSEVERAKMTDFF